jgi:hypothetical protein
MWSLVAAAPYAIGLVFFAFIYFVAIPYVEYLRDPKGMLPGIQQARKRQLTLCQACENTQISPPSQDFLRFHS